MSTYTIYANQLSFSSTWTDYGTPSVETKYREFDLSDLGEDTVVTEATLSADFWGDAALQTMNGSTSTVQQLDPSTVFSGARLQFPFVFQGKNSAGLKSGSCSGGFQNIVLRIVYQTLSDSVTAPTTVSLSKSMATPGEALTLRWSGAIWGYGVSIGGYDIYRATAVNGPYVYLTSCGAKASSCSVSAPAAPGSYYFKVKTLASQDSSRNSGLSSAYAAVTVAVTAPAAPAALSLSAETAFPEQEVVLSWADAEPGLSNPIRGYALYTAASEAGPYTKLLEIASTETSGQATVSAADAGSVYFRVVTLGVSLSSAQSAAVELLTDASSTSDFSLSAETVEAGEAFLATLLSCTDCAHTLSVSIGDFSQTLSLAAGSESAVFTPPLSWLAAMPSAREAQLQVCLATEGAGRITKTLLLRCPDSQTPLVSEAVCAPAEGEMPSSWGVYVQGKSQARITLNSPAQSAYGASILRYEITGCGAEAVADTLPITALTDFLEAGEQQVFIRATDSRGLTGEQCVTLHVEPYSPPEISGAQADRRDAQGVEADEGTYIHAAAQAVCASCGGHNSVSCAVAYKPKNQEEWTYAGDLISGALLFGGGQMDISKDYDIRLLASDAFGAQTCQYLRVPRAEFSIHFQRGGKAAAFFGPANRENTLRVYGNLQVDGVTKGSNLFQYDASTNTLTIQPFEGTFSFDPDTGVLSIADDS